MTAARFNPRTTPARPGLAAEHLRGRVDAERFVAGELRMVRTAQAPVRRAPRPDAPLDTEALRGEIVIVYDEAEGWAWVQLQSDGYVGYMPDSALGPAEKPNAKVAEERTFIYPGPSMKLPITGWLAFGATCEIQANHDGFARIAEGFVFAQHLRPVDDHEADFVGVAERFLGVPYLWGGKTSLGLDCSGLVQVALQAAGIAAPRDSDIQARSLGNEIASDQLRRGDLVFWPGHVGIMRNPQNLLHANGHTMLVSSEPLSEARERIAKATGAAPQRFARLQPLLAAD